MEYLLINMIFIIYISAKLLYFNFSTEINTPPFRWKTHKKTLQAILSSTMFVNGIFLYLEVTAIWYLIFALFIDILVFSDTLYMRYYKNPLTISVVIHQIKLVKGIRQSVIGVIQVKDFLYFMDIPLWFLLKLINKENYIEKINATFFGVIFISVGLIWFFCTYLLSNRKPYYWNKKRIARDLGITTYHIYDLIYYAKNKLKRRGKLTDQDKQRISEAIWVRKSNKYSNIAKDKNVVVVQMESMQDFLINLKIREKEVTPNLNLLIKENIRFENMYYQTSVGNTSDAELLFNNSLFPISDKPTCYEYQRNEYDSIGHAFKKKGYLNYAFHGNQASFWNRNFMYPTYGYDKFIDNSILINDEFIFPGLSDNSFFRQCVEFIKNKRDEEKTFAFLISLSLHHPYDYFNDYDFPLDESLEGTFLGKYIKGAHYADKCIGYFIKKLKDNNMYDDSLLVMYGDHSGIPKQYRSELMRFLKKENNDFNWTKTQKVAAFMHIPGINKSECINKVVGQIDILPTIANISDLDIRYALGRDIFDEDQKGGVITRDKVVIAENYISFPDDNYVININTGEKMPKDNDMKLFIKNLYERLYVSDLIIEKDGIKQLKGQ